MFQNLYGLSVVYSSYYKYTDVCKKLGLNG